MLCRRGSSFSPMAILLIGLAALSTAGCDAIDTAEGDSITYKQSPVLAIVFGVVGVGLGIAGLIGGFTALPDLMVKRKLRKGMVLADDPSWYAFKQMLASILGIAAAAGMLLVVVPNMLQSSLTLEPARMVIRAGSLFAPVKVTEIAYDSISSIEIEERRSRGRKGIPVMKKFLIIQHGLQREDMLMNAMHEAALPKLKERAQAAMAKFAAQQQPAIAANEAPAFPAFPERHHARPAPMGAGGQMPGPASPPANPAEAVRRPFGAGGAFPGPNMGGSPFPGQPAGQVEAAKSAPQEKVARVEIEQFGRYKAGGIVLINTNQAKGLAKIIKVYQFGQLLVSALEPPHAELEVPLLGTVLQRPTGGRSDSSPPGTRINPAGTMKRGMRILARWGNDWFPAHVVQRESENKVKINWDIENTAMSVLVRDCCQLPKDYQEVATAAPERPKSKRETPGTDEPDAQDSVAVNDEPEESIASDPPAEKAAKSSETKPKYRAGQQVEAHWGSSWYPAKILQVAKNGMYQIRYTRDNFLEVVDDSRLRLPEASDDAQESQPQATAKVKYKAGDKVEAFWGSSWYPAEVIKVFKDGKDGRYQVRYTQDGWVGIVDRTKIRPVSESKEDADDDGDDETEFEAGDHVEAQWAVSWYDAKIIKVEKDGRYTVRYTIDGVVQTVEKSRVRSAKKK